MKSFRLFARLVIASVALVLMGTSAQAASFTIEVITTFDYPGTGNLTRPQKINDMGDIAGEFLDSSGVTRGFVRLRNGSFSPPIVEPNQDSLTDVRAINNSRLVAGYYIAANVAHGFFLSANTYTEFDTPGALNTYIDALNNAGDFAGTADFTTGNQAFLSVAGNVTLFTVPGAVTAAVYGLNNLNQAAGGYFDSASVSHGFLRDAAGTLTYPIDPLGSTQTFIFGNNDRGWMVGRYVDGSGATHGLFMTSPTKYISYDYPGATFTSLNGINRQGLICGRYLDNLGIEHGILARVKRVPSD
jgi:hypothetical protein